MADTRHLLTGFQAQAFNLTQPVLDTFALDEDPDEWFVVGLRKAICRAFRAQYSSALTTARVLDLVQVLDGQLVSRDDILAGLQALVRAGVLRSHRHSGLQFFELNFEE